MRNKTQIRPPEGFRYQSDVISIDEEQALIVHVRALPLKEYEFHGFTAKRRVIYYGWQYNPAEGRLNQTEQIPSFLHELRERAASFAHLTSVDLAMTQIIEYGPGAAIGWHRDRDVFGDIIGISLLSQCSFRFRRRTSSIWERYSLTAETRSIYLLR
jgi:alkylated DNA repair dioxygenase AlkB